MSMSSSTKKQLDWNINSNDTCEFETVSLKKETIKNEALINDQVIHLLDLLETMNLYRKGMYLYEPCKWAPRYNIMEFAWTFCNYPPISTKVGEKLELCIPDIKNPANMTSYEVHNYIHQESGRMLINKKDAYTICNISSMRLLWFMLDIMKSKEYYNVYTNIIQQLLCAVSESNDTIESSTATKLLAQFTKLKIKHSN